MNIFNLFKSKKKPEELEEKEISKELFIEETTIDNGEGVGSLRKYNLENIYVFSETDFEQKGYDDALINPDNSYSNDNIKLLKYDLHIKVKRAYKAYEDYIKDIKFHIQSRKDAGLIDTVKLLETELEKIKDSIREVKMIEEDFDQNTGLIERISLSYKRGFMRGLAAMSDKILERNAS